MPGGRRLGAPTLDELDLRLSRIEQSLLQREAALVRHGDAGEVVESIDTPLPPLQPQNMRLLKSVPGSIVVAWDPVPNRNVIFYELRVLRTEFGEGETFQLPATQTRFDYRSGTPDQEYFFRVRAFTEQGRGPYSSTVSSVPGRAERLHLQIGSAKHTGRFVQTEFSTNPLTLTGAGTTSGEYGFFEFETLGGPVLIFAQAYVTLTQWGQWEDYVPGDPTYERLPITLDFMYMRVKEDGETIHEAPQSIAFPAETFKTRNTLPYVMVQPAAPGLHTYSFEVELVGDDVYNDPDFEMEVDLHELQFMLVELRA